MVFESIIENAAYFFTTFIILLISELLYFRIARRYLIGDKVTKRSSHHEYKLTGGGIIFIIAAFIYYLWYGKAINLMLIGAIVLATISFIDDIKNTSPILRLVIHSIIIFATFSYIIKWGYIDIFIVVLVCGVGFINAYNFMDGINGITAGYSLVTLSTLLYCFNGLPNAHTTFIITLIIATLIFAFFNFRKNAICFAGDVGSITMGYFILYLIIELIWAKADATCIVFVMVYGIDTVYTIFQRLFIGENIFTPHRHHLYQVLANQWKISHHIISIYYTGFQLLINIIYFTIPHDYKWTYVILIIMLLSSIYFLTKRSIRSYRN